MSFILKTASVLAFGLSASLATARAPTDFRWIDAAPEGVILIDAASISGARNVRGFELYMGDLDKEPAFYGRMHVEADCTTKRTRVLHHEKLDAKGKGFDGGVESNPRWSNPAREEAEVRMVNLVCATAKDRDLYAPSVPGDWRRALVTAHREAKKGLTPAMMIQHGK